MQLRVDTKNYLSDQNQKMKWTILLCAIVMQVIADDTETSTIKSQIDLRVVCSSTMETSCTSRHASYGVWMFYRRPVAVNDIQNVAKVIYNETECLAISRFTINCSCIDGNNVTCNISDERIVQAGDSWQCKIFTNAGALRSIMISVPNEENNECATAIREGITDKSYDTANEYVTAVSKKYTDMEETYNKTTPVTISKQGTLNSTMNYDRKEHENNNTTTSVKLSTTYTINHTKTTGNEDSDTAHDFTFSNREMIIIIAAVGVTIVITATVCICAYWKLKGNSKVLSNQVTKIDNTRSTEPTPRNSSLGMIQDDTSLVHYYEIQDITILRDQVTGIENIRSIEPTPRNSSLGMIQDETSLVHYHEIPELTSSYITVTYNANSFKSRIEADQENTLHDTDNFDQTIPMPEACNTSIQEDDVQLRNDDAATLREGRVSFITFAEINTTQDAVNGSEIHRLLYSDTGRYESLGKTETYDRSHYNTAI